MILTKEAQTLLRHISEMGDTDADAIPSNAYLAEGTDWESAQELLRIPLH